MRLKTDSMTPRGAGADIWNHCYTNDSMGTEHPYAVPISAVIGTDQNTTSILGESWIKLNTCLAIDQSKWSPISDNDQSRLQRCVRSMYSRARVCTHMNASLYVWVRASARMRFVKTPDCMIWI